MMPKLTPWFTWPTKPTRVGWYDVEWHGYPRTSEPIRAWWNGDTFYDKDGAWAASYGFFGGDQWRGLAEPPEGK